MTSHIRPPKVDWLLPAVSKQRVVRNHGFRAVLVPDTPQTALITLRSAGGIKLAQWKRSVTYVQDGSTSDFKLWISGDIMLWLNNYSRRVKVQLTVKIGRDIVLALKPVKIRAGEVYVLKPPLPIRRDGKVTRSS